MVDWREFFKNIIDTRGRLVPGLLIVALVLLLIPGGLAESAKVGVFGGLMLVIVANIVGATNLFLSFRLAARLFDKPHPVTFYEKEMERIRRESDEQVFLATIRIWTLQNRLRWALQRRPNATLQSLVDAACSIATHPPDRTAYICALIRPLARFGVDRYLPHPVDDLRTIQSTLLQVREHLHTLSDGATRKLASQLSEVVKTVIDKGYAENPRLRSVTARAAYFRTAFGEDYFGRWDQKVVFDTIKTRLLSNSVDSGLSRKVELTEARVNSTVGLFVPLFGILLLALDLVFRPGNEMLGLEGVNGFTAAGIALAATICLLQNGLEFHRQVRDFEPRLIYEAYFQRFVGSTPLIETKVVQTTPELSLEQQYKRHFHRHSNSMLEAPPDSYFRSYRCSATDLLESKLFPVWHVTPDRSEFIPYYDERATSISLLQIAGVADLMETKLKEWEWDHADEWAGKALQGPYLIELCEGCGRRVVKDGCHRLLLLAALSRGKRIPVDESIVEGVVESMSRAQPGVEIPSVEWRGRKRFIVEAFEIDVLEIASTQWREHSISDMQRVCRCEVTSATSPEEGETAKGSA